LSRLRGPGFGWLAQYIFDRFGKFPATVSSMIATIYLQAHSASGNIGSDVPARASPSASRQCQTFHFSSISLKMGGPPSGTSAKKFFSAYQAQYARSALARKRTDLPFGHVNWRTTPSCSAREKKMEEKVYALPEFSDNAFDIMRLLEEDRQAMINAINAIQFVEK
jgi:hypothetical protein